MPKNATETGQALRDHHGVTHVASWTDPRGITHVAHRKATAIVPEFATVFCGSLILMKHQASWDSVDCMTCLVACGRLATDTEDAEWDRLMARVLR